MERTSPSDRDIEETAARLADLQAELGEAYWQNEQVRDLQAALRRKIGAYGAWSPDQPPLHQRARLAAKYESDFAHLLWPR